MPILKIYLFPIFGLNFLNVRLLKTRDLPSKKPIEFLMIGVIKDYVAN